MTSAKQTMREIAVVIRNAPRRSFERVPAPTEDGVWHQVEAPIENFMFCTGVRVHIATSGVLTVEQYGDPDMRDVHHVFYRRLADLDLAFAIATLISEIQS